MNEELRLKAVKQFEQLHLKYNRDLNHSVAYAAKLCRTPISLISLLGEKTQWIKVSKGFDFDETDRKLSFCTHTIKRNRILVVNDTHADKRFSSNPFVKGSPKIRFYAGAPLITNDGQRIGAICVMGKKPHLLSKEQKLMLKILAKHIIDVMSLVVTLNTLEKNFAELKQVRQDKAGNEIKLRSMFESLTDAYFLLGKKEEVLDFNPTAYRVVNEKYNKNLTIGCMMAGFFDLEFREIFSANYQNALNGQRAQLETLSDYGSKGKIWWDCAFEPVKNDDGEIIGVSYVARNINERKLYEEKILGQNSLLLKIAEIQSHDYRGPVATILGLLNLIEEEDFNAPKEYIAMLQTSAKMLDKSIHEVVKIASDPKIVFESAPWSKALN